MSTRSDWVYSPSKCLFESFFGDKCSVSLPVFPDPYGNAGWNRVSPLNPRMDSMLWILVWDPGLRTKRADGERRSSMSLYWDPTSLIERFVLIKTKYSAKKILCENFCPIVQTVPAEKRLSPTVALHTLRMPGPPENLYGPPWPGSTSDIPFYTSRNVRLAGESIVPERLTPPRGPCGHNGSFYKPPYINLKSSFPTPDVLIMLALRNKRNWGWDYFSSEAEI